MAITEPSGFLSGTTEDEERQSTRAGIRYATGHRHPDHGECLRVQQFVEYYGSAAVDRRRLDVNLCRWAIPSRNFGLVRFHSEDGRWPAGVVLCRIRVHL